MTARPAAATVLLALVLVATGCSSADPDEAGRASSPSASAGEGTTLMPGGPGEDNATGEATATPSSSTAHADIAFMQMMVPHHAQAIEMSDLARSRARDAAVGRLAARIRAAQGPEILEMADWLEDRNVDVPSAHDDADAYDHGQHGHAGMQGMLTDEQMARLEAADGAAFDRLFLEGMVAHHAGAIAMAEDVARSGTDVRVSEIATDIRVSQAAEIETMRDLLARL